MGEVSDLIEATSSPADLAVVLLAGTAGLVVDAGLGLIGLPSPALTAFACAGGALGLKKSADAYWDARRARRERGSVLARGEKLRDLWVESVLAELPPGHRGSSPATVWPGIDALETNLHLHRKGLLSDEALNLEVDKSLEEYRTELRSGRSALHLPPTTPQPTLPSPPVAPIDPASHQ